MEKKINIAELLKDCSTGMELDCTMYEDVYFDYVDKLNIIHCYVQHENYKTSITFNQHGTPNSDIKSKCVIFPKGKTTWEGFQRPFKDGDILISGLDDCGNNPFIFKQINGIGNAQCYCAIVCFEQLTLNDDNWTPIKGCRLATEEEKQKLFQAIKDNGYKWNPETKTLEKLLKFKVGDKITKIDGSRKGEIFYIDVDRYHVAVSNNIGIDVFFEDQDEWKLIPDIKPKFKVGDRIKKKGVDDIYAIEIAAIGQTIYTVKNGGFRYIKSVDKDYELVSNKFDITTLKPFDKVLVRADNSYWRIQFFERINKKNKNYPFVCMNGYNYKRCIPYEGNEHLLGTANDCDEFYKKNI